MSAIALKSVGTRLVGRSLLLAQKHGPEILTGLGIVAGVASTVMAAKATLKLEPLIDELNENLEAVRSEDIPEQEQSRARAKVYVRSSLKIGKLYGPAVGVGIGAISCVVAAHGIMKKRNVALIAAYNLLERSFAEYRGAVAERLNEEDEYQVRKDDVELVKRPNDFSIYAVVFDEFNRNFNSNPAINRVFLNAQQTYANDLLRARGHVFLNDVYDALGFERTSAGAIVGWVMNKGGDNYIDFGVYNSDNPMARRFINGDEASVILDFNVDGVVFDLI